jgi:hypothetical protein
LEYRLQAAAGCGRGGCPNDVHRLKPELQRHQLDCHNKSRVSSGWIIMVESSYPPLPPIRPTARDWLRPALVLACLGALASLACNLHQASQIETLMRMLRDERDARLDDRKQFENHVAAESARHVAATEKPINKRLALVPAADAADRAGNEIAASDDEFPPLPEPEPDDRLNPDRQRADLWQPEKLPDEVLHADDPGRRKPGIGKRQAKQAMPKKVPSSKRPKPVASDVLPPRMPDVGPPAK